MPVTIKRIKEVEELDKKLDEKVNTINEKINKFVEENNAKIQEEIDKAQEQRDAIFARELDAEEIAELKGPEIPQGVDEVKIKKKVK